MEYFVYILYSDITRKYYVGQTEDVNVRLELHNSGAFEGSSTKAGIPWQVYLIINCNSREEAIAIEHHIKAMKSTKYYHSLKAYPEIILRLKEKYQR